MGERLEIISKVYLSLYFPQRYLHHVRQSTAEYFGVDNCCGVNAFGYIQNKKAIQDSFRVYDFEQKDYNKVSKEINNDKNIVETILENKQYASKYTEYGGESNPNMFRKAIDIASNITGNIRQAGTHAAGMIITPRGMDMFKKLPVMLGKTGFNSQYDKVDIEYAGFLKMDLLGLRNLDIIQDTLDYIKRYRDIDINITAIPLDDEKTYSMYGEGDTDFIFQVESQGMKNFLRKLKPRNIEDIIVVLAGYRPGPMAYLETYVKVRNGQEPAIYRHELIRPILEVTGGISFYQEQIMDIFKSLAGYSLGRADLVRRALGKKSKEILAEERKNFIYGIQAKDEEGKLLFEEDGTTPIMEVKGCINNGIDEETASQIYDDILPFADYGFNKSHAAGYAILSYRTGYLKANYFLEYATAVLRSVEGDKKKLTPYANIVKSKGVDVLFPSVNKSSIHMDIYDFDKKVISAGLLSVSGLPEQMAINIVKEREENGEYKTYHDFLKRMSKYHIDKKSITSLVSSGALDEFDKNFNRLLSYYEYFSAFFKRIEELNEGKQRSIFDIVSVGPMLEYLQYLPDTDGYDLQERLSALAEYNNVGLHEDITKSFKDIKFDLNMARWQRDDEFETKEGVVSGILEGEFALSKKGKAYLNTFRTFEGDIYKLIVSKKNVDKITDDITEYKKGMAVDIIGSYKFPKYDPVAESEEEDEESQGFVNNEVIVFPNKMIIKRLDKPFISVNIELNFDNMNVSKEMVSEYFGVDSFGDIVKKLLSKTVDENVNRGKYLSIRYNGRVFTHTKKVDIPMNDIKKMGCEYKIT